MNEMQSTVRKPIPVWAQLSFLLIAVLISYNGYMEWKSARESAAWSKRARAKLDISALSLVVTEFAALNGGQLPPTLDVLIIKDENGEAYLEMDQLPLDPWGEPYEFELLPADSTDPRFLIWSRGSDGELGGVGTARDFNQQMIQDQEI